MWVCAQEAADGWVVDAAVLSKTMVRYAPLTHPTAHLAPLKNAISHFFWDSSIAMCKNLPFALSFVLGVALVTIMRSPLSLAFESEVIKRP